VFSVNHNNTENQGTLKKRNKQFGPKATDHNQNTWPINWEMFSVGRQLVFKHRQNVLTKIYWYRKAILEMIKLGRYNYPHNCLICPVPIPKSKPLQTFWICWNKRLFCEKPAEMTDSMENMKAFASHWKTQQSNLIEMEISLVTIKDHLAQCRLLPVLKLPSHSVCWQIRKQLKPLFTSSFHNKFLQE